MHYYQKSVEDLVQEFSVDLDIGLTDSQIKEKQTKYGKNIIQIDKKISAWKIFLDQFKNLLILILISASIVSVFVWEMVDAIVIIVIVIMNAVLGFVQEYKAEKSIESLKKMASLKSRVLRDGREILINSVDLVPGDILIFSVWDKIGADARIISSMSIEINESILTGESLPVLKKSDLIEKEIALADQKNMIFAWTTVSKWHGRAIVCAIGMQSEIWKIADMIQELPSKETNLQKELNSLSKWLIYMILLICLVIFIWDFWIVGDTWQQAFLIAIALSVAAIPEWLPAVVTIALWLWVKKLVKKNALMRKLSSVETLGAVNVICTDKTWTLTKNEMTVKYIFADNKIFDLDWVGYKDFWKQDFLIKNKDAKDSLQKILEIWVVCNNSNINSKEVLWDPTEIALLVSAMKWGLYKKELLAKYPIIDEIPFDSKRKIMTVVCQDLSNSKQKNIIFSKWAPEILIEKCWYIFIDGKVKKMTEEQKESILTQNKKFAKSALRVLWFAYKIVEAGDEISESDLIFVWLQAMIDPPRLEVEESILQCKNAWIRVVMITGDNVLTAKAIADEIAITGMVMDGLDLDKISDIDLEKIIDNIGIFARVTPMHKLRIIKILKKKWNIVAMTWDGINDAPALKHSDIGLAMGITGTDVAKEASDVILLDDNFSTIVNAIYEWRWIYDNIKKFVNYLLSTNFAEILIIFIAVIVGLPLPLLAIQILRMNLITDGLPALALGVDPVSPDIMSKKPRKLWSKIVDKKMLADILILSLLMAGGVLFFFVGHFDADIVWARTGVLLLLTLLEMLRIWIIRKDYNLSFWSNKWLIVAVILSIGLVLWVIYIPFFANIFHLKAIWWTMRIEILWIVFVLFVLAKFMNVVKNWLSNHKNLQKKM